MIRIVALALGLTAGVAIALVAWNGRDTEYRRLLEAGDAALRAGDAYAALESLSGALALKPDSMVAFYRRAEAYRAQRRPAEATRDLREASRLAPDATEPLIALGQIAAEQGDHAQAAVWFSHAADRLQSEDNDLLYTLALARYRAGAPATAIEPLRRVLAKQDATGRAHQLLGLAYRDTNRLPEAQASLEEAIRIAPSLFAAREELADLFRSRGQIADELAQLTALAALDPQPERHAALAFGKARAGDYDAALALVAALPDVPNSATLRSMTTARVYLLRAEQTGDRKSARLALDALGQALGGSVSRSEGLALYGRALFLSGDTVAAEKILHEAIATSPVEVAAFGYLADAAERGRHPLDARDALLALDALEGDTASRDTRAARHRRIGALSLDGNDVEQALRHLRDAMDAGMTTPDTLGLFADACLRAGEIGAAQLAIDRALEQAPGDAQLIRLARRIKSRSRQGA